MSVTQKTYVYKVYRSSVYLGNLPYVTSEFTFVWDINTAGTTLTVVCGISADISRNAPPYLTTEDGRAIITESGQYITASSPTEIIATGTTPGNFLFRNGNQVEVYEFTDTNVNGKIVFRGTIERIGASFGTDGGGDQIQLLVYSDGADLNNAVVPGSNSLFLDQSQTNQDDSESLNPEILGQIITTGVGVTNIAAIDIMMSVDNASNPHTIIVNLYNSPAEQSGGVAPLATTSQVVSNQFAVQVYRFTFPTPVAATQSTPYFFTIQDQVSNHGTDFSYVYYSSTPSSYARGHALFQQFGTTTWRPFLLVSNVDQNASFYFAAYSSDYNVDATFTTQDPSTILKSIIDTYVSRGGLINYSTGTVDLTDVSATYTFSLSTIFSAIQVCLALAPFGFYWYVDLGTNILYFKHASVGADITLTKDIHINSLDLVMTTENIVNLEYFSGGNAGTGPNLFRQYSDQPSIQSYRPRLSLQSDNRVTIGATADLLGAAYIAENKDEQYQTEVVVLDTTIDTTLFKPGLNIGFNGFGTFVDYLVLQIVSITYEAQRVTLTLGRLPPRINPTLQEAANAINALQTIDNPSAPS